jgi:hypothetical protein
MKNREVADVSAVGCIAALRAEFPSPAYALFEQVGNGVGWTQRRWADAIVMGIWPSRGLLVHGFEIKVDRADWKRELKNPKKAEEIQSFCDRWWIAAPAGLIAPDELPPTWGLYEVSEARKAKIVVKAPELSPKPLTKSFVAAILRRHGEAFDDLLRRERSEGKEEGAKDGHGELARRIERLEEERDRLRERVETFQKKSGVMIDTWAHGDVGEAVRALTNRAYRTSAIATLRAEESVYKHRMAHIAEDIEALVKICPPEEKESEAAE